MIRNRLSIGGLAIVLALAASQATTQQPAATRAPGGAAARDTQTIWQGVYTTAQARRGQRIASATCSGCHSTSEWSSPSFLGAWNDQTVADLFDKIHSTMPKDAPGSLSRKEYVDVITYMFRLNGVPAGQTELDSTDAALREVRIRFPGP